ncbi:MAG: hypothetical protein KC546_05310 [Anaerolineae bacterium]|nr:hypothetical protein [Anaerolineae bacterium]MCA9887766.1 hypothetical protein [Anaerolineae bacterium]MCB9460611.1 hypothetical protein [Anaerolineaceae bacterium]
MSDINLIFDVAVMFIIRIGIPLLLLVVLGTIIDRWQRKLHAEAEQEKQRQAS